MKIFIENLNAFHCIAPRKCTSSNIEKDPTDVSCNIDGLYKLIEFFAFQMKLTRIWLTYCVLKLFTRLKGQNSILTWMFYVDIS